MPAPIVLLTDFGHGDWFVGAMKGVIAGLAPDVPILDLTHGIAPGDIEAGAFALWAAYRFFPEGSIFVAVVDPGVGGPRDALLVAAHGRRFIGPDNGLLSRAVAGDPRRAARSLHNPAWRLPETSRSFHGRDIFAPAAARLAAGAKPSTAGPLREGLLELPPFGSEVTGGVLSGTIVHIDRFGNAITSISAPALADFLRARKPGSRPATARAGRRAFPLREYYAEASPGRPLALLGSCGLLELSLRDADAAASLGLRRGQTVSVR